MNESTDKPIPEPVPQPFHTAQAHESETTVLKRRKVEFFEFRMTLFWPVLLLLLNSTFATIRNTITLRYHKNEIQTANDQIEEPIRKSVAQTQLREALLKDLLALEKTNPGAARILVEYYGTGPEKTEAKPEPAPK